MVERMENPLIDKLVMNVLTVVIIPLIQSPMKKEIESAKNVAVFCQKNNFATVKVVGMKTSILNLMRKAIIIVNSVANSWMKR